MEISEVLERKIVAIIGQLRPYVEADGGAVVLDSIEGGVVRLKMRGPDSRCNSLLIIQKLAIERRLLSDVPGIDRVDISAGLPPVLLDSPETT